MFKLFLLLCISVKLICGKTEIPIGVIFDENSQEIEIAFRASIQRANIHDTNFQFVPIIKYVTSSNSFKAEKTACEFVFMGVAAIFVTGPQTSGIVESLCNNLKIPYIIAHWVPEPVRFTTRTKNMTINLYPDSNTLSRAFSEVIVDNKWKGYTIIYETDEGLMKFKDVLGIHGPNDKPITVRKLGTDRDNVSIFKKIRESGSTDILLECKSENLIKILKQAKYLDLLGEYERFILISLDTHTFDLEDAHLEKSNISSFRLFNPASPELMHAISEWEQTQKRIDSSYTLSPKNAKSESALMYDAVQVFAKAFKKCNEKRKIQVRSLNYRYNDEWEYGERITNEIKKNQFNGITGPILINPEGQRILFELDIIELSKAGFNKVGIWNPTKKINYTRSAATVSDVLESLQHKVVTVVSKLGEPFLMERVPKDGEYFYGNDRYEGYSLDLVEEISKILHFTYKFELVPDGNFGNYNPEKKEWDGVVRHIMDRKADIGVCDLTITYDRRTAVDFTVPYMTLGISILYTAPPKVPPNLFSFLSPLSQEVWLYTASAYLAVSLMIYFLARMSPAEWLNPHPCNEMTEEVENIWNLKNCTWVTVGSIMGQGSDILPKAVSTRIVCGMWWFFALIMLSSYTANLAAFLTNDRMGSTIDNVEQLASQSTVKYGVLLRGSTLGFFQNSNNTLYQKMWAVMENEKPSVFTESNKQGADRVAKSKKKYAFFMESSVLDYMMEQNCELTRIGGTLDTKGYGIALPMNSKYRKEFNAAILQLQEHGKLDIIKKKWWRNKDTGETCGTDTRSRKTDTTELGVGHVGGVFVILLIGCLTGLLIGIIEFLWNVKKVAVIERLTPWEAFMQEIKFAIRLNVRIKSVHVNYNTSSSRSRSLTGTKSPDSIH